MSSNKFKLFVALSALVVLSPAIAEAQAPIGVRAEGLAGAFVGVADDASAVYWNPAGLASGAYVSFVWDYGRLNPGPNQDRQTGGIVAISTPPLGIAYYRMATFGAGPLEPVVSGVPGREEVRSSVHALTTSTVGVALLHSVGDHLVVGATLKLLHGATVDGPGDSKGDVDVAAMSTVGRLRFGVVARNLTAPSFALDAAGKDAVELQRQVRVGGGWGSGWPGDSRVVLAVDADVTRRIAPGGDRRDLAAGAETWWLSRRLGVRAGVRRSTVGAARSVVAAGVSGAVRPSMFVEGHIARGQQDERSWSVGARFGF